MAFSYKKWLLIILQYQGFDYNYIDNIGLPIPVAVRSKAWVFGGSLTGIVGSNPA